MLMQIDVPSLTPLIILWIVIVLQESGDNFFPSLYIYKHFCLNVRGNDI